jgi:hypothetical protein
MSYQKIEDTDYKPTLCSSFIISSSVTLALLGAAFRLSTFFLHLCFSAVKLDWIIIV